MVISLLWALYISYTVKYIDIQTIYTDSNIDNSFNRYDANSFLSPYEILLIAEDNKYLRKFSYFITKLYVMCTLYKRFIEVILISTHNISLVYRR